MTLSDFFGERPEGFLVSSHSYDYCHHHIHRSATIKSNVYPHDLHKLMNMGAFGCSPGKASLTRYSSRCDRRATCYRCWALTTRGHHHSPRFRWRLKRRGGLLQKRSTFEKGIANTQDEPDLGWVSTFIPSLMLWDGQKLNMGRFTFHLMTTGRTGLFIEPISSPHKRVCVPSILPMNAAPLSWWWWIWS